MVDTLLIINNFYSYCTNLLFSLIYCVKIKDAAVSSSLKIILKSHFNKRKFEALVEKI